MSPLFRRSAAPSSPDAEESAAPTTEPADTPKPKAYTPAKGRPTPKRAEAEKRKRAAEPPPANQKEARARMREKMRAERAEQLAGAARGDERFLMPRDRGPVRRLVRNLVDARRNMGPVFFLGLLVVVVSSMQFMPPVVQFAGTVVWLGLLILMVVDAILISRLIKRAVSERHPDTKEKMRSLYFYGIMRSVSFRRIRHPKPQVNVGDTV